MKVLGMISGVGSMLIGAKEQGWDIVGNIEWRPYYHTGTFEHNFPEAFMAKTLEGLTNDQIEKCKDLDLIIGHTECGNFSNMRPNKNNRIDEGDKGDIPEFVDAIIKFSPKMFAMDNLPKSLLVADWNYYASLLPEYEIHFEWVSNYGYGNVQKNRKRLFIIGAKRDLGFYFIPNENEHETSVLDRVSEVSEDAENHDHLDPEKEYSGWGRYQFDPLYADLPRDDNRLTFGEFQELIADLEEGKNFPYYNKKGQQKFKIGYSKIKMNGPAMVLSGGGSGMDNHFRSDTLFPFTIRERAKIQGCPDDFVFFPKGVDHTCKEYNSLIKQTGKFMPVEFCSFLTQQISEFLEGSREDWFYSGERTISPNNYVDQNKHEFCSVMGYTNQEKVCEFCGSKKYCEARKKDEKNG